MSESGGIKYITESSRICRTCLAEKNKEDLCSLFENSLDLILLNLTEISVRRDDGLPGFICNDCIFTLNLFVTFKEQCQKSDAQLRRALYSTPEIYGEYKTVTVLGDNISTIIELKNELSDALLTRDNGKIVTVNIKEPDLGEHNGNGDKIENCDNSPQIDPNDAKPDVPLKCDECNRTFKLEGALRTHLIKHGKKLNLKCEVCGKEFTLMTQFKCHVRTHSNYKPFSCTKCDKSFSLTSSLTKHMRTHGGERKHLCITCGKRFYEPGQLNVSIFLLPSRIFIFNDSRFI
jgi:hypothetical protein